MAPRRRIDRAANRARAAAARNRSARRPFRRHPDRPRMKMSVRLSTGSARSNSAEPGVSSIRWRAEGDHGTQLQAIQTLVAQDHGVVGDDRGEHPPTHRATQAAHLEHIAEVRGELQAQRQPGRGLAVIAQPQALVEAVLPDQPGALDMNHALAGRLPADRRQRPVGEVGGEQHVVLPDRTLEQRQRPPRNAQPEAGKQAGIVVEQAIAVARDVTVAVGDHEGVAMLEREQLARRAGAVVVGFRVTHQLTSSSASCSPWLPSMPRKSRQ